MGSRRGLYRKDGSVQWVVEAAAVLVRTQENGGAPKPTPGAGTRSFSFPNSTAAQAIRSEPLHQQVENQREKSQCFNLETHGCWSLPGQVRLQPGQGEPLGAGVRWGKRARRPK